VTPGFIAVGLAIGFCLGVVFVFFVRSQRGRERRVLAIGLSLAAAIYVVFALVTRAGWQWLIVELAGASAYTVIAVLGVRRTPGWLVLGWATHPVWDMGVHLLNGATDFAPSSYELACISFDWLVAFFILKTSESWTSGGHRVLR